MLDANKQISMCQKLFNLYTLDSKDMVFYKRKHFKFLLDPERKKH
jgi:hypothetical protein